MATLLALTLLAAETLRVASEGATGQGAGHGLMRRQAETEGKADVLKAGQADEPATTDESDSADEPATADDPATTDDAPDAQGEGATQEKPKNEGEQKPDQSQGGDVTPEKETENETDQETGKEEGNESFMEMEAEDPEMQEDLKGFAAETGSTPYVEALALFEADWEKNRLEQNMTAVAGDASPASLEAEAAGAQVAEGAAAAWPIFGSWSGEGCGGGGNKPVSLCMVAGDPHVQTFDFKLSGRGWSYHPMWSPGHYWLVRTKNPGVCTKHNIVSIQAKYGKCGYKNGGGWQRARKRQDAGTEPSPPNCVEAIALGGSFLDDSAGNPHKLQIATPCDFDWENVKCREERSNPKGKPRIVFDGKALANPVKFDSTDPYIKVTESHGGLRIVVETSILIIHLHLGRIGDLMRQAAIKQRATYMNVYIFMRKDVAGMQSGHCGNFDGRYYDDLIYDGFGELNMEKVKEYKKEGEARFNDAVVKCRDRMIPEPGDCKELSPSHQLSKCEEKDRKEALEFCQKQLSSHKLSAEGKKIALAECIEDACVDPELGKADAEDSEGEDEEEKQR